MEITVVTLVEEQMSSWKGDEWGVGVKGFKDDDEVVRWWYWCVCAYPYTKGMRSIISTVSISPKGFLPSILLLVVIVITVLLGVVVSVYLVVVVVALLGVDIVVTIIGRLLVMAPPKFVAFEALGGKFPSILWGNPLMKAFYKSRLFLSAIGSIPIGLGIGNFAVLGSVGYEEKY
ncbi:hypothetical protein Tco_0365967 [Tanacetum coccineum]